MAAHTKLSLLAGALFLYLSCGTTARTVNYVNVDRPVYSPAPSGNTGTSVSNTSSSSATLVEASQSPKDRIRKLADTKVNGYYRGYGTYSSTDEDLAIDMAQTNALAQMSSRATTQIQKSLDGVTRSTNTQATNLAIRKIKQVLTEYTITDWSVVDSYVSDGPTYEACYCVEAPAANIVADLKPLLNEMEPKVRQEVIIIINQGYK